MHQKLFYYSQFSCYNSLAALLPENGRYCIQKRKTKERSVIMIDHIRYHQKKSSVCPVKKELFPGMRDGIPIGLGYFAVAF